MSKKNNKRILEEFDRWFPQKFIQKSSNWGMESDPKPELKRFLTQALKQQREENIKRLKKAKEELIQDRDNAEFDDIEALFNGQIIAINKEIEHYQSYK